MTLARDTVVLLKKIDHFYHLRKVKIEFIQGLKADFAELQEFSKKLDDMLSDKNLREEIAEEIKKFRQKEAEQRKKREKEEKERKREIILQSLERKTKAPRPIREQVRVPPPREESRPSPQRMTDADRLAYTLDKIEAKLAELTK